MKQKFITKKTLTKMVGLPGWEIYKDTENGLYAYNRELVVDHPLMMYDLHLNNPKLDKIVRSIRNELIDIEINGELV